MAKSLLQPVNDIPKKLVIAGDDCVGKTSILLVFVEGKFHEEYVPIVYEPITKNVEVAGKSLKFSLWDTNAREDVDQIRPLSYPGTDVILLCFSFDLPDSFEHIRKRWNPEMKQFCPEVPIILVGNKKDLRDDENTTDERSNRKAVQQEDGQVMAKEIGALRYLECSARTMEGIGEIFQAAALTVFKDINHERKQRCEIQ